MRGIAKFLGFLASLFDLWKEYNLRTQVKESIQKELDHDDQQFQLDFEKARANHSADKQSGLEWLRERDKS